MNGGQTLTVVLNIIAVLAVVMGLAVLSRKREDDLHRSFFILALATAGWIITNSIYDALTGMPKYVDALASYVFASFTATFFYIFSARLASRTKGLRQFSSIGVVLSVMWGLPGVLTIGVTDEGIITTPVITVYALFLAAYFATGVILLLKGRTQVSIAKRRQINIVLFGVLGAIIGGVVFNLILPLLGNYQFVEFGPVFAVLYVAAFTYTIMRYQLFDVRAAIARSVAYLAAVGSIGLGLGLFTVFVIDSLGLEGLGLQLSVVLAMIAITIVYPPIKHFFDEVTDDIFFQKPYDTQQAIDTITGLLVTAKSIDSMLAKTASTLQGYIGAESVTITLTDGSAAQRIAFTTRTGDANTNVPVLTQVHMLADKQRVLTIDGAVDEDIIEELDTASIAMIAQLSSQTGLVGYVLFGYKQNGSSYTARDIEFIDIVSDELAIAIQSMLRYQEIAEFNAQLKQRIESATSELRVTNRKLQSLDKSKDEFISMASHQLRTPLTSVKGYISMILDGDAGNITKEQRQLLQQAYESSQRMVFLIGDFLNVSRLQTGKFMLELSDIDLAELTKEEVEQLADTARSRQITIEYKKPADSIVVSGDENKLRQVMMNFIDNAIFYSQGKVTVQLHKETGGVVFKVIDTGIGVPKSEQPKLFTKFFRATNARQQRPDGTGIGLYMAKKVVVAHGGTIVFDSKEGKGSTFGFRLPLKDQLKQLDKQPDATRSDGRSNGAKAK